MAYSGRFKPSNPYKYKGNTDNIVYRSLWELKLMKYCDLTKAVIEWGSEEISIPYYSPIDGRMHRYYPDFYMKVRQKDKSLKKFIVEVKPKKDLKPPPTNPKRRTKQWFGKCKTYIVNKAKFKYATEYCQLNDIEFKILTEDHLQPRYK